MPVTIRRLAPESKKDIDGWRDLYHVVFGREFPEEVWRWKYIENPFRDSDGPLIYLAESNNQIVGARSLLPSKVTVEDGQTRRVLKACQFSNAMVHPDFRRQGIFMNATKYSDDDARRKGYQLAYGYPNNQSLPGHMEMGCVYVGRQRHCAMVLRPERILADYFGRRGIPQFVVKALSPAARVILRLASPHVATGRYRLEHGPVERFAEEIANLHLNAGPRRGIFGLRSIDFLSWHFGRPDREYRAYALYESDRMAAYMALHIDKASQSGSIEDIYAPGLDRQILARLIKAGTDHLRGQYYGSIGISLLDREWPLKSLFSPLHAVRMRYTDVHLIAYALSNDISPDVLSDRNNWYLQQADISPF